MGDKMDILGSVKADIVKRRTATIERPPKDFNKPYNMKAGIIGGGALGTLGFVVGSSTGVALLGTAISGAWILAPILGLVGLAAGSRSSK
jgi:hypothetical protein